MERHANAIILDQGRAGFMVQSAPLRPRLECGLYRYLFRSAAHRRRYSNILYLVHVLD